VIVYDMLGHGDSALPAADVTLRDYADQLAGLLNHLGIAANVVGHSMGALVALEFALAHPERVATGLPECGIHALGSAACGACRQRECHGGFNAGSLVWQTGAGRTGSRRPAW
jgi:pimeloyl-ACP methyl ester carboxylesterase